MIACLLAKQYGVKTTVARVRNTEYMETPHFSPEALLGVDLIINPERVTAQEIAKIVKNPDGEIWCISKHLLSTSMRLMEVGTKKLGNKEEKQAKDLFDKAYALWNIFWGLNLNLIDIKDVKQRDENENNNVEIEKGKKFNVFDKLGGIIKSIMDCCKE